MLSRPGAFVRKGAVFPDRLSALLSSRRGASLGRACTLFGFPAPKVLTAD